MEAERALERITVQKMILSACMNHPRFAELPEEDANTIVRRIERSCYNLCAISCERDYIKKLWTDAGKAFKERYSAICYKIATNIDVNSVIESDYLINKICDKEIDPKSISDLSSYELCPVASKEERDFINERQKQKVNVKFTDKYTCHACKSNKATYYEVQLRSADEASSLGLDCLECGYHWIKSC